MSKAHTYCVIASFAFKTDETPIEFDGFEFIVHDIEDEQARLDVLFWAVEQVAALRYGVAVEDFATVRFEEWLRDEWEPEEAPEGTCTVMVRDGRPTLAIPH